MWTPTAMTCGWVIMSALACDAQAMLRASRDRRVSAREVGSLESLGRREIQEYDCLLSTAEGGGRISLRLYTVYRLIINRLRGQMNDNTKPGPPPLLLAACLKAEERRLGIVVPRAYPLAPDRDVDHYLRAGRYLGARL